MCTKNHWLSNDLWVFYILAQEMGETFRILFVMD